MCTEPSDWSGNGFGACIVTVTVRVLSFATTVGFGGTYTPSSGDLFAGLPTKSRFALTVDAVSFVPSAHVIPARRTNRTSVGETMRHELASPETIFPPANWWMSV